MILVPEQIKGIRKGIREGRVRLRDYADYFASLETVDGGPKTTRLSVGNDLADYNFYIDTEEYKKLKNILAQADFLKERDTSCVNIGTKFKILFLEDGDIEEHMLVESLAGVNAGKYISTSSPVGEAVFMKHEGDIVSYKVGNSEIKIQIMEIAKEKKEYLGFIRDEDIRCRISTNDLKSLKKLKETNPEEYRKCCALTTSQVELLEKEFADLTRKITTGKVKDSYELGAIKKRLKCIENLLKENNIVSLKDDETIGVGSTFTITVSDEDKILKEYEVEMINKAVSTEVASEYLEKFSYLGKRMYGLSEGESFDYAGYHDKKHTVTVSNIRKNDMKRGFQKVK